MSKEKKRIPITVTINVLAVEALDREADHEGRSRNRQMERILEDRYGLREGNGDSEELEEAVA